MPQTEKPAALREWAVAVKALEEGRQVIVLRKGGIAEETRDFRLESPSFYLFPSFEHQKPHLVKPEAADALEATRAAAAANPGMALISSYAEAVQDLEIYDAETLKKLSGFHIWTDDYAEERLKWKKTKPLHVLILRVYRLDSPVLIPLRESYGGCKSWLRIEEDLPAQRKHPVLDDGKFESMAEAVRQAVLE